MQDSAIDMALSKRDYLCNNGFCKLTPKRQYCHLLQFFATSSDRPFNMTKPIKQRELAAKASGLSALLSKTIKTPNAIKT
jgi:hypothetical protein